MNKNARRQVSIYLLSFGFMIVTAATINKTVNVVSQEYSIQPSKTVIIDAGHGGVDSGAVSINGAYESKINLDIALRLNDLMHLLGIHTKMIRTSDCSVYTKGETIAQKKVSDLKQRVRLVNETDNGYLISIHQNYFTDEQYAGAQIFYSDSDDSKLLAAKLQQAVIQTLNKESHRAIQLGKGIYLLEQIERCGILVECGFLSNSKEEAMLISPDYQKKLSCVIACVFSQFLYDTTVSIT